MKPDADLKLLVRFAHSGCVSTIAEDNFDPGFRTHELSAGRQIEKLKRSIEDAKRIGLLCEQFKNSAIRHDIEAAFDDLDTKKKGRKK